MRGGAGDLLPKPPAEAESHAGQYDGGQREDGRERQERAVVGDPALKVLIQKLPVEPAGYAFSFGACV
eukprot:6187230-Pyramimonas_sp.AAC.1